MLHAQRTNTLAIIKGRRSAHTFIVPCHRPSQEDAYPLSLVGRLGLAARHRTFQVAVGAACLLCALGAEADAQW